MYEFETDTNDYAENTPRKKSSFQYVKKRVYIRSATPVPNEEGEYYFNFSPLNKEEGEQDLIAKIDMSNPLNRDMLQRLSDNEMDITTINLKFDKTKPGSIPQISGIGPGLNNEARKISVGGKHASTWTRELDQSVDLHYQYRAFQRANEALQEISESPDSLISVIETAKNSWERSSIDHGIDGSQVASSTNWDNLTLHEILQGGENGKQVRYNPDVPFEKQVKLSNLSNQEKAEAFRNYTLQRALNDEIVDKASKDIEVEGVKKSYLGHAQDELVRERSLYAGHPSRTEADHKDLSQEYLEMVGSMNLQGLMDHNGAASASAKHDSILKGRTDDSPGQKNPFLQEISERARNTKLANDTPESRIKSYIANAKDFSAIAVEDTKKPIRAQVDEAMQPGFSREDPIVASKDIDRSLSNVSQDAINGIEKGLGMSAF